MKCAYCGKETPDGLPNCVHCGHPFTSAQVQAARQTGAQRAAAVPAKSITVKICWTLETEKR